MDRKYWNIFIDTGGTFTDCIGYGPEGQVVHRKVLSNATLRGRILKWMDHRSFVISEQWGLREDILGGCEFRLLDRSHETTYVQSYDLEQNILRITREVPRDEELEESGFEITSNEEAPVFGARLITGTPVDFDLPPMHMKLGSTIGTNSLLQRQGADMVLFITRGFRDLLEIGNQQRKDIFARSVEKSPGLCKYILEVEERIDAQGHIIVPMDTHRLMPRIEKLRRKGIHTAAICLLNSYLNPEHEQDLKKMLLRLGFRFVSVSTELSRLVKYLQRTETSVVNAYLSPVIANYLEQVRNSIVAGKMHIMTSSGSLFSPELFAAKDSLLSGPAGGVVGCKSVANDVGIDQAISFDMGGTSTDVSRIDKQFDYTWDLKIGDARIFSPAFSIETVAAGGGSICYFDGFKLNVGPQSAGAHPGPACYGAGGPLTLTDVNLLLGRLDTHRFEIPIFLRHAEIRLHELLQEIEEATRNKPLPEEVLTGFIRIADEIMAGAIKKISVRKGYDPADFALVAFGGAGGMHASGIADSLNIKKILIPCQAGMLSAFGISRAPLERFAERQILKDLKEGIGELESLAEELEEEAKSELSREGISTGMEVTMRSVFMRFTGQDSSLDVPYEPGQDPAPAFRDIYKKIYGHWHDNKNIEIETLRVLVSAPSSFDTRLKAERPANAADPIHHTRSFTGGGWQEIPVYDRALFADGQKVDGPAIILDHHSTAFVPEGWTYTLLATRAGILQKETRDDSSGGQTIQTKVSELELFTHRFMFIAENMGAMMQRTSSSVNVKERLDFSCAVIDAQGYLVANAPHIPVHLGSLGVCVRSLMQDHDFKPGDTLITNHPRYGGSHLPDLTMVTPVFWEGRQLIGFVVNRAHHAELGGMKPGSMPPDAKNLEEEGVVVQPFYLVRDGSFHADELEQILTGGPWPTRALQENLADIDAALASNMNGRDALLKLAGEFGPETVMQYMSELREYASRRMSVALNKFPDGEYHAVESLDDGNELHVGLDIKEGHCRIDFTGSAPRHPGNMNATPAIVQSVVIYVLRLILDEPIPLNEGILQPVEIHLPAGLLNPDFSGNPAECPAVVGGNVEVSQRLTDTLLKAFGVLACSQGTMNNVLIGNEGFSYYETICGGCGAGPGFNGASAVHHHMTNTRITDPEILETRYPLRLESFRVRNKSGGKGRFKGGKGVVREIRFLEDAVLSVITQHRNLKPYGLDGGKPGKRGRQYILRNNGQKEKLQPVDGTTLQAGDLFVIKTPGGGGYGTK